MGEKKASGAPARARGKGAGRGPTWTAKRKEMFFAELALTCNVTKAAAAAGMSQNGAYARRRNDPGFRAGWARRWTMRGG